MKILIWADNHYCQYSSILRSRGSKYSTRLENQIQSLNWINKIALEKNCESMICLGDFFDKESLNSEELTALNDIEWNNLSTVFLVGNHEMGRNNLSISSSHILNLIPNITIMDSVKEFMLGDIRLVFLPYVLESERKPLNDYFKKSNYRTIVFSHNDISGIQMGQFISKGGFSIDEIEDNCNLFINGHIHNGQKIANKIVNLGNLTGQNFSENAFVYDHNIMVLDIDTLEYELIKNPYSLNFYKIDFTNNNSIDYINEISSKIGSNSIVTIKCKEEDYNYINCRFGKGYSDTIPKHNGIIESRIMIQHLNSDVVESVDEFSIDHYKEFQKFIIDTLGTSEVVLKELEEILS